MFTSLRSKGALTAGLGALVVMLAVWLVERGVVRPAFRHLERAQAEADSARVSAAILNELRHLGQTTSDWAEWDDACAFADGQTSDFVRVNLPDMGLIEKSTGVNLCYFFDPHGRVLYRGTYDTEQGGAIAPSVFAGDRPAVLSVLPSVLSRGEAVDGFLRTDCGLLFLSARPILSTQGVGPPHGMVVFGRVLDAAICRALAVQTGMPFDVLLVDDPRLSASERDLLAALTPGSVSVLPGPGRELHAYTVLGGLGGVPAALIRIAVGKEVSDVGARTSRMLIVALGLSALLIMLVREYAEVRARRRGLGRLDAVARLTVVLVLLVGLALSYALQSDVRQKRHEEVDQRFSALAGRQAGVVLDALSRNLHELEAARRFYEGSETVTLEEFGLFVSPILRTTWMEAIAWVPHVPSVERAAFEASIRDEGLRSFQITDRGANRTWVRAGDRAEFFPITYSEPHRGDNPALGYDLGSDRVCREAIAHAGDTGQPVMTHPVRLAMVDRTSSGVLIFVPVYKDIQAKSTLSDRRAHLTGFILGVVRGDAFAARTGVAAAEQLAFVLHDVSADAGPRFICRTRGRGASELSVAEPDLVYAADLPVANRIWRIEIRPTVAFVASNTERGHWFVFVAGVLLTLLMVMLLVSQLHEAAFLQSLLADHEQQELRNALRLKSRVLLSAVGVAVLFAALGLAFVYVSVHRQSASQTGHLAEAAAYEFQRALAAEARTLRAQAVGIEGSAALAAAWLGGDWQAVRALTSPQFEQLERELGAERIALLDADRIVRSGAGSASGCEAEVGRQATSAARQRGDEAWGLELASGGVRLVYARPLRWGGQIRGYCKMDVSVDGVLARLSTPGTRQLVLLDERDRPVSGVLPSGLEAAIRRQPARAMTGVFELQASAADGRNEGRRWSCRMVPERDVTGSPTVQLLVMRSTDSDVAFRRRLMVVLVLAAILVAVVLLVVLSQVAGGMEKRLGAAVIARERAHQARQLTEGILSSTLRSIGDGVISVDADKRITLMNTRAESLTGWSQAEAAGKPLDDVCRIVGAPAGASVDRALALGQTVSQAVEATLMARDGSRRQVTDSAALMRDEHGRVSGVVLVLRDVTAENVTRRELQAKKQELERYFSNSLDLLCIADTDGYFRRMNPEWERTLGYTLEELEGKFYPTFVHPEDVAATLETLANLGDQKTVLSFTNRFRAKDGRYRSIEWRSLPQGNLIYSAARDVTERRQAEDALRAGEERLARINTCLLQRTADCDGNVNRLTALAGELMGAMCALYARVDDANGCLTLCGRWCVPGGVYATGLPAGSICHEAIQGDSGDILYVTDLQASAFAAADEFVRTQGFGCCVAHVVRSGEGKPVGSLCVLFAGERVLQATDRQILGILAAAVESEEAHREAEAGLRRLASAINQAAESVLITNAAGVIEYVNPAFERTSGYSRGEVVGRTPALLKSGQHDTVFYRNLRQTLAGGSMWSGRFINRRKNGTLYQEDATISPVCDENGRVVQFVAVQKDVTHEVELQDQLQQAQRMEAVGLLAGGVAHDLNNLLAPILGYGEMLLVDHSLDKPRRRDLVEMIKAAERARDLVRQLMAFGRKQALDVKLLDVNAVVADFSELMRSTLREDIRLDMRLAHGLPCVKADRGQLEQVLMNLAMNAQEAMPHGGALVIETAAVDVAGELAVSQAGVGPGRCVTLTVSDSGVGMDEQTLARVFDPFFTTKEMGKGMGLGLATVYGIVKQHGGGIRAHSAPGCGATFRIHLPASASALPLPPPATLPLRAHGGTETILLAEDEQVVREMTSAMLRSLGYHVVSAETPGGCLALVHVATGPIDLLLTDVVMPGMDGRELSRQVRESMPLIRVLYMSGYTANVIAECGILEEGTDLLPKPFGRDDLARKVREVLDR